MKPFIQKKGVGLLLLAIAGMPILAAAKNTCTIGASAFASGTLTCINTSILLRGNSTTAGVTYSWTGPNGFTSTLQSPTVTTPGTYTVVVTSPAGCTGTASVTAVQNIAPPANVVATTVSGSTQLTCIDSTQTLSGSSSTAGSSYAWTGPGGFTSSAPTAPVNQAGTYRLFVTNPANGCTATADVTIASNQHFGMSVNITNNLTCLDNFATLIAHSGSPNGVPRTYSWTGPYGFSASTAAVRVTWGGIYTVTVTDTVTGCSESLQVTEFADTASPVVTITNSGPLTCSNRQTIFTASSSPANLDYLWLGPDGYFSIDSQAIVTAGGDYSLLVSNLITGCSTTLVFNVADECPEEARRITPLTSAALLPEAISSDLVFNTYPNPYRGNAQISFRSPLTGPATIQVYNTSGILEKRLFDKTVKAGQLYQLPLTGLPAGVHYVMIRVNNKVYTKKVVALQ